MSTTAAQVAPSTPIRISTAPTSRGLFSWMKAVVQGYRRSMERRASVATLRSLDDHLLKDIGIDRSEITSMVYGRNIDRSRRERA